MMHGYINLEQNFSDFYLEEIDVEQLPEAGDDNEEEEEESP